MKSKLKFCTHTAVAALLVGLTGVAAQAQNTDSMETVTVTGFRASLATALETKQRSNLMVEAVAPEDIGKMPDKDVAESLQRLPGVQIDRSGGEGTTVRIRGLSYNIALLDGDVFVTGREMYTTGEGSGAGNGNLFQNSLEGIPSALIGGVDVYKSPKASLVAGALGGTIDLRVRSALDGKEGFTIGGNLGMSYSQGAKNATPQAVAVAQYKFSNQLGLLAAVSYDEHDTLVFEAQSQNRNGWTVAGPATGVDNTVGKNYLEPELSYLTHQTQDRKRLGTFLGLDWNPTSAITSSLTWFHSFLIVDRRDVTDKVFIHSNGEAQGLLASPAPTIDANGVVMQGTFSSHSAETSAMVEKDKNIGDNFQANLKFDNGGKFRISAKFSLGLGKMNSEFSQADVRESGYGIDPANGFYNGNTLAYFTSHAYSLANYNYANPAGCGGNKGVNPGSPSCNFSYTNHEGLYPVVSYTTPDLLTNPAYVVFKSNWAWDVKSKNNQWAMRTDAEYDILDKVTASAGLRYAAKTIDYDFGRYLMNGYGNGTCNFDDTGSAGPHVWHGAGCTTGATVAGVVVGNGGQGQLSWESDQAHRGPWTYYQDPSLPNVSVQTGTSNPSRLALVKNFFPAAGINTLLTQDAAQMQKLGPVGFLELANPNIPVSQIKRFKDVINSFKINSKVSEGYFMFDIGQPTDDFHINTGVRVVHTQLDIGQYTLAANPVYLSTATWNGLPNDAGATYGVTHRQYTDILPSLNVVANVGEGSKIRFSAARVMAEANPWNLGAGFYTNFTHATSDPRCNIHVSGCSHDGFFFNSASGGNNQLDPYRANQLDLAYEFYFGKQGLLSAGLFWKGVDSFTQNATVSQVLPDDFGGTAGGVSTVTNGKGGRIQGIELTGQYAWESGFGINANYTYAQSSTANSTDFAAHLGFPGVAKNAFTIQGYYESNGFAGRLSYTWKGSALNPAYQTFAFASVCPVALVGGACPSAITTKTYGIFDRSYGQLDGQISYEFFEHFGVVLEGRNLAGSATSAYLQFKNQPFLYDQAGRSYALSFKFNY